MDNKKYILLLCHLMMVGIGFGTAGAFVEFLEIGADIKTLHAIFALAGLAVGFYSMLYLLKKEDK